MVAPIGLGYERLYGQEQWSNMR